MELLIRRLEKEGRAVSNEKTKKIWLNPRRKTTLFIAVGIFILLGICLWGVFMDTTLYAPNYDLKRLAPSLEHPFGTDNLGRDMFYRTICGLSLSIKIGLMAAFLSSVIALILGSMSAIFCGWIDDAVNFCVDLCMGVPHLVLLLLISIAVGGGANGVIFGVVCTHWPGLTRIVRAEVMQIRSTQYVQVARKMGKSRLHIAMQHIVPHVFPQYIVGLVLLFPHAILHEAGVTFLGYGLSLDTPAVGIILSESMKYLATGMWWLGFFPGIALLLVVHLFNSIGDYMKILVDPQSSRE